MSTVLLTFLGLVVLGALGWWIDRRHRLAPERRATCDAPAGTRLSTPATVTVSDTHLTVAPAGFPVETVAWADVREVVAFKEDLFSYDLICLHFLGADRAAPLLVHEEMAGFDAVCAALPERLPGCDAAWREAIAGPAFAANTRTLWSRDANRPS